MKSLHHSFSRCSFVEAHQMRFIALMRQFIPLAFLVPSSWHYPLNTQPAFLKGRIIPKSIRWLRQIWEMKALTLFWIKKRTVKLEPPYAQWPEIHISHNSVSNLNLSINFTTLKLSKRPSTCYARKSDTSLPVSLKHGGSAYIPMAADGDYAPETI